jgi:hypothetical protein
MQHGKPHGVVEDGQPDAREGRSGRRGATERPVVPMKPGNAGGGKGPWFRTDAISKEGQEIGQPSNSEKCSETAEGVTRESEDGSRLSLLRLVRQDLPRRHPGPRLCPESRQQGRTGRRRSGLRGRRGVRGAAMARRSGACAQGGDLPTRPHQTSVYPQSQRQTQTAGYPDGMTAAMNSRHGVQSRGFLGVVS